MRQARAQGQKLVKLAVSSGIIKAGPIPARSLKTPEFSDFMHCHIEPTLLRTIGWRVVEWNSCSKNLCAVAHLLVYLLQAARAEALLSDLGTNGGAVERTRTVFTVLTFDPTQPIMLKEAPCFMWLSKQL